MANSSFSLSYWQRFRMWLLSKRTGRLLAIISSVQTSIMAYIGSLVWLNHIGAAAQLINPIAWVTLGTVLLVELSILTKMTQEGAVKASLVADVDRRYAVGEKKIVDFDPIKHLYYLKQAEWLYLESNEAVSKLVTDDEATPTMLSRHRKVQNHIEAIVEHIHANGLCQDDAFTHISDEYGNHFSKTSFKDNLHLEVFRLHVLRRLKFEAHESERAYDDAWLESVIQAIEAKLVVAQYNDEQLRGQGSYRQRALTLGLMTLFVVAPAAMIWGWMGYYQFAGSLIPLLAHLGLSASMMGTLALPFAIMMGLGYFLQIFQTMSFSIISGFWSRWWESVKNIVGHMWASDAERTPARVARNVVGSFVFLVLTLGFMGLGVLGAMCGVLTYRRIFEFNKIVQWIEVVTVAITEASYGFIYTAFSSMLINRMLMFANQIGHFFDRLLGQWWDEYGALFQLNAHAKEEPLTTFFRLFPAAIGLFAVGLMTLVVGTFETVIFFVHAIMLGFLGDNNSLLPPDVSDGVAATTEVGNDTGLYFGKEEHDHGLFDDLKHLICRAITLLPALLSTLCLWAAPDSDKTRAKYRIHVSPWHTMVVSKRSFLYQWARFSVGHIKEVRSDESSSTSHTHPGKSWGERWDELRLILLAGMVVYMVLSVCVPALHLVSVGSWLLLKLTLVSQVAPWMNLLANGAVLALTCTLYSLLFGKLGSLLYRSGMGEGIRQQHTICDEKVASLRHLKSELTNHHDDQPEKAEAIYEVDQMIASLTSQSVDGPVSDAGTFNVHQFLGDMAQRRWSAGHSHHTRSYRWACGFFARYEHLLIKPDNKKVYGSVDSEGSHKGHAHGDRPWQHHSCC